MTGRILQTLGWIVGSSGRITRRKETGGVRGSDECGLFKGLLGATLSVTTQLSVWLLSAFYSMGRSRVTNKKAESGCQIRTLQLATVLTVFNFFFLLDIAIS